MTVSEPSAYNFILFNKRIHVHDTNKFTRADRLKVLFPAHLPGKPVKV